MHPFVLVAVDQDQGFGQGKKVSIPHLRRREGLVSLPVVCDVAVTRQQLSGSSRRARGRGYFAQGR